MATKDMGQPAETQEELKQEIDEKGIADTVTVQRVTIVLADGRTATYVGEVQIKDGDNITDVKVTGPMEVIKTVD